MKHRQQQLMYHLDISLVKYMYQMHHYKIIKLQQVGHHQQIKYMEYHNILNNYEQAYIHITK